MNWIIKWRKKKIFISCVIVFPGYHVLFNYLQLKIQNKKIVQLKRNKVCLSHIHTYTACINMHTLLHNTNMNIIHWYKWIWQSIPNSLENWDNHTIYIYKGLTLQILHTFGRVLNFDGIGCTLQQDVSLCPSLFMDVNITLYFSV